MPADHSIKDEDELTKTIEKGIEYAEKGRLLLLEFQHHQRQVLDTLRQKIPCLLKMERQVL